MVAKIRLLNVFTVMVFWGIISSCATTTKQAVYMDTAFDALDNEEWALLPALDLRVEKKGEINVEKHIRQAAFKKLQKKGYNINYSDDMGGIQNPTEEELRTGDASWIKRLGPSDKRMIMVLSLSDVSTKLTFGSTGNAELSGFLFDKTEGKIIWRDKGIGRAGQGGLLGMVMKGMMDEDAIKVALDDLLASIPKCSE